MFDLADVPFAASSSWNTPIPVGSTFSTLNWPASTGYNYWVNWDTYSPAVYVASASDPVVRVTHPAGWGYPAETVSIHIPAAATGATGTDGELLVIDRDIVYNFWQFDRTSLTTATASSYGATDIVTGSGWGSKSPFLSAGIVAAGASELAGLIVKAETADGSIDHALQLAVDYGLVKPGYTGEAISGDGGNANGLVQEGQRLAISPNTPMPSGLSALGQEVFVALQKYGAFVVDVAGGTTALRVQENDFDAATIAALQRDVGKLVPLLGQVTINTNPPPTPADQTSPTISGVVANPGTATLTTGNTVTLTVNFNETVTLSSGGKPSLTLNNGGTANYVSGSGSKALTFSYVAAAGQDTADLAVTRLELNGATIRDAAGNNAVLSGAATNPSGTLEIDTTPSSPPATSQSLFSPTATPSIVTVSDGNSVELGVKFQASVDGTITGVRFYKGPQNTGTHIGDLWSSNGTLLATATFTSETASGWQQVNFSAPVSITAGMTYVASYHTNGYYSDTPYFFNSSYANGALTALGSGAGGVYAYGATPSFPTNAYHADNYWVDVVFVPKSAAQPDQTSPTISSVVANPGTATLTTGNTVTLTVNFNETVTLSSGGKPSLTLNNGGTANYVSGSGSKALTFSYVVAAGQDTADLSVTSLALNGATIKDAAGNNAGLSGAATNPAGTLEIDTTPLPSTPQSLFSPTAKPSTANVTEDDGNPVELGVKFQASVDGTITGVRFYKGPENTGTHIGQLWSSNGALLATATFTSETASGWQQVNFSNPVSITAGTTYVASYHTNGYYSDTPYFFNSSYSNGSLTALGGGAGGVYAYGVNASFPTNAYHADNYWVDVVFVPDGAASSFAASSASADLMAVDSYALLAGVAADTSGPPIDTVKPTVTTVTTSPASEVASGPTETISLAMSEKVTVSGAPILLFDDGSTAIYKDGSGSSTLAFAYTPRTGQAASDLRVSGIVLPSAGAIADLAGNEADLSGLNASQGDPAGSSYGRLSITGTTELELFDASSKTISFASGAQGELKLDASSEFAGRVEGFSGENLIDLADIAFGNTTTLAYASNGNDSGGILTVSDGAHAANIALLGQYSAASFVMSADQGGGTLIQNAQQPSLTQTLAQPHYA